MVRIVEVVLSVIAILPNFSNCGYCPAGVPTIKKVSKCPSNQTEWEEAATLKKCSYMSDSTNCGNEKPVYHCLLNQWRNETIEVCTSTWFMSGFCAVYNTIEMKITDDFNLDCTGFNESKCPSRYISSEAYKYQECYMYRKSSNAIPLPDTRTEETNGCILSIIVAVILSVLFLVIGALLVFIIFRLKISKKAPEEECIPFCNVTKQKMGKNEEDTPLMKNESEVNQTKNTADSSSTGNTVGFKPKPEKPHKAAHTDTGGFVDDSPPGGFNDLKARFESEVNQTKNTADSSSTGDTVELKQKPENPQKAAHTDTGGFVDDSRPRGFKDLKARFEVEQKADRTIENEVNFSSPENHINEDEEKDEDPAADKENSTQKDDIQSADNTIKNDVDCSSHKNLNKEEDSDEEKKKLPGQTTCEKEIIKPNTEAQNTTADEEKGLENEVEQKTDETIDLSSPQDPSYDEDNDEEKTQSQESTSSECVANTTNAKSTEFEQKADDTDEGGDHVFPAGRVKDKKNFFEKKAGN